MNSFVFDLDGTLLNTLTDIANACNSVLGKNGFPENQVASYASKIGGGFEKLIIRALPPDITPDPDLVHSMTLEGLEAYRQIMEQDTKPYPGMETTLAKLAAAGSKLAILSNKPDDLTAPLIEHFFPGIPFAWIQGAKPGAPLKPNPTTLLTLLRECGLAPQSTYYVGDTSVDVATAHNAGVKAVGAAWGFRGRQELQEAGADYIADYPNDLLRLGVRGHKPWA